MADMNVGILGIGVYLPDEIRTNEWWPKAVVEKWAKKNSELLPEGGPPPHLSEGERRCMEAIAAARREPFCGAKERRVAPESGLASEMETAAAREAIERSGIDPAQIGFVLGYSQVPDYLTTPNSCAVHKNLGLSRACFTTDIDGACNTFLQQLTLAEQLIRGGNVRYGLLTQSTQVGRLIDPQVPSSAWFGEGATAVVVGPVADGCGILGRAHGTDGATQDTLVASVPGRRWYEDGRIWWYPRDRERSRTVIVGIADLAREVVSEALNDASLTVADVDFYACHQATEWFSRVTKDFIGLGNARTLSTFPWAGSLSAANVPLVLATAEREHLLKDRDVVATFSGGSGMTWSSVVLRWGH
ncbi:MAG: hypothetical protein HY903_04650 [Deltaproteobacteria bacterium]|nr:hypothetical protein [Deltaproteobacteria bacterium]